MACDLGTQSLAESAVYRIELRGEGLTPSLLGIFDGTEILTAKLWPGGDYEDLATLAAEWADTDNEGNAFPSASRYPVVLLTISRASIAGLEPGTYQVRVYADVDSVDQRLYEGSIALTASAGLTELPRTYCTFSDVLWEAPWLDRVEATADSRAASFLPERDAASRWAEELALARWDRDASLGKRLAGPAWGLSQPWTTGSALSIAGTDSARSDFQALLTTAGLIPDATGVRGPLRRAVALKAAALALEDQVGTAPGDDSTSLQALAMRFAMKAGMMLARADLYVDSDDDDVADYWFGP